MRALETKYHGPTDSTGSRVSVGWADRNPANRRYYDWQYELDPRGNHERALAIYLHDRAITGSWCGGGTATGYVWVYCTDVQGVSMEDA